MHIRVGLGVGFCVRVDERTVVLEVNIGLGIGAGFNLFTPIAVYIWLGS